MLFRRRKQVQEVERRGNVSHARVEFIIGNCDVLVICDANRDFFFLGGPCPSCGQGT